MQILNLPKNIFKRIALLLLGPVFIAAGANHFLNPNFYIKMMPPYLPLHRELVYLSGVFEILGGLGVLIPKTRKWAAYGLIALLIAVFPANLYMAMEPEQFADFLSRKGLYMRLPFQLLFIAWVYGATQD